MHEGQSSSNPSNESARAESTFVSKGNAGGLANSSLLDINFH